MAYTPQAWADGSAGGTPISAARLSYIETGIQTAAAAADSAVSTANDASASAAAAAHLAGAETFTGAKVFGPTGGVNDRRVAVYAENAGQVANTMEFWCGADKGQGSAPQLTTYMNEKGELRVICAKSTSTGIRFKGQPGQTANILEITDTSNVAQAWVGPDYTIKAPNLGMVFPFGVDGTLSTGTGVHRIYNDTGVTLTIRSVRASVGTAPTGSSLIVDINVNGVTIFTTQSHRPTIAASANTSGAVTNMDVTTIANGAYFTVDLDQVGSTVAGSDLTVQLLCY